jgi:hypothetical protein
VTSGNANSIASVQSLVDAVVLVVVPNGAAPARAVASSVGESAPPRGGASLPVCV